MHPQKQRAVPSQHLLISDIQPQKNALVKLFATNDLGWGAFLGIAFRRAGLGRYQRGGRADLLALPALFVDIDEQDESFKQGLASLPAPSWQIASSKQGLHLYWLLERPQNDFPRLERLLKALANYLKSDSSMSLDQSMRLPGSINWKPEREQAVCQILEYLPQRYPLEAFAFLEPSRPEAPLPPSRQSKANSPHEVASKSLNPSLMQAITNRLVQDYGAVAAANGWYLCRCIFPHQRENERHASWNPEKGLYNCFGKHGHGHLSHEIASVLGISIQSYGGLFIHPNIPERKRDVRHSSPFRSSSQ